MARITPKRIIKTIETHNQQLRKYQVKKIGLFGSFLKKKEKNKSDMDFLVVFRKPTFDNYMNLKFFLEKLFHRKVDLVTENSLKPALQYVKKEALYAKRI